VLTGGKTMCRWVKEALPEERLANWPSEAELMADIIRRYYGDLYKKRYVRPIDDVIIIEDKATNTLENFSYTINRHPDLLKENKKIGFLSAKHHLERVTLLAQIFSIKHADESKMCAEEILREEKAFDRIEEAEEEVIDCVQLCQESQLVKELEFELRSKEEQFIQALQDPKYLTYWFGYLGDVKNPRVINRAMKRLNQPEWVAVAESVFRQVGLDVREYQKEDLCELSERDPNKYFLLVEGLKKLKKPEYRRVPKLLV
jgi:hypothetical protein